MTTSTKMIVWCKRTLSILQNSFDTTHNSHENVSQCTMLWYWCACWLPWLHSPRLHIIHPAENNNNQYDAIILSLSLSYIHTLAHSHTLSLSHTHTLSPSLSSSHAHTVTHSLTCMQLTELDYLCSQRTVFVHQHSMLNSYIRLDH